ncbi:MAG: MerR family transcriptional regulator [Pseudomonadota bacterium]
MKISEVADRSGLSIDTIRYYERIGLCPPVQRGSDGHRAFTQEGLDWLTLLASLRETGMPMERMRAFADLYRGGDATVAERRAILLEHRERLKEQHDRIARCETLLDHKLERYEAIEGGAS